MRAYSPPPVDQRNRWQPRCFSRRSESAAPGRMPPSSLTRVRSTSTKRLTLSILCAMGVSLSCHSDWGLGLWAWSLIVYGSLGIGPSAPVAHVSCLHVSRVSFAAMSESPSSPTPKPWQHRIGASGGGEGEALAQAFVESISYDRRMYKQDIAGSIAHA